MRSWPDRRGLVVAAALCAGVAVAGVAAPAEAHQSSVTHSTVVVAPDQTSVAYRVLISPGDLIEVLPEGSGDDPSDAAILAAAAAVGAHVTERIEVLDGDTPCPAAAADTAVRMVDEGGRFVEVRFVARCPRPMTVLVIEYQLFFDLDPLHAAMIRVEHRGDEADDMLREDRSRFVWELGEPPPSGLAGFLASGIDHIFYGFDHIAFLLGLLLLVVIAPGASGVGGGGRAAWRLRDVKSAFVQTAAIVTAFTVAHSLTLIAAVLGWVRLPDRLVEVAIALSIVFVAAQNVLWPHARQRWVLGFGFGLVHGLGFARMLAVQLPSDHIVPPLLAFNGGVELGQLAIVLVSLPVLHLAARHLGGPRYRAAFLPAASGIVGLLGLLWLIERAADVTILGF